MFAELNRLRLIKRAKHYFRNSHPIPLDLFAALIEVGVDVDELAYASRP